MVRAGRRGLTLVWAATGGVARASHEVRVPAVDSPPVAAVAGDALPLKRGGLFGCPKPCRRSISDRLSLPV